jgi:hypothetical protein
MVCWLTLNVRAMSISVSPSLLLYVSPLRNLHYVRQSAYEAYALLLSELLPPWRLKGSLQYIETVIYCLHVDWFSYQHREQRNLKRLESVVGHDYLLSVSQISLGPTFDLPQPAIELGLVESIRGKSDYDFTHLMALR